MGLFARQVWKQSPCRLKAIKSHNITIETSKLKIIELEKRGLEKRIDALEAEKAEAIDLLESTTSIAADTALELETYKSGKEIEVEALKKEIGDLEDERDMYTAENVELTDVNTQVLAENTWLRATQDSVQEKSPSKRGT